MKQILTLIALTLSLNAFSGDLVKEFDEATETRCHSELKQLGCVDKNDIESMTCAQTKKANLTKGCQDIVTAKAQ